MREARRGYHPPRSLSEYRRYRVGERGFVIAPASRATSPVNEFRVVFNAYFESALPILPDVTYLSPDVKRWSEFVEDERP